MLEGPMLKFFPRVVVPQPSVAVAEPLMVMENVDPELVSVAEPATVQFVDKLPDGSQLPVTDSVAVVSVELPSLVVVKVMLPGTIIDEPLQVSVKL
jgi:hypothetical protein